MASSGSKSVTVGTGLTLKFSWSEAEQSVANNTTKINWQMDLVATSGYVNSTATKSWNVTVNGAKYSGTNTIGISKNTTKKLASGSTTISHNADGTKTFSYSFSQQFSITYSGSSITTKSGSGSGTLDPISRVSSVAATNAYIDSNTTITITRHNSGFKHTLQYKLPGQTAFTTIVSKTANTTYSWKLDSDEYGLYELIPEAKSMTITINCITYNGDTKIGEKTTTLKASCKESLCAPYFYEPSIKDINNTTKNLTGNENILIRYYSKAQVHSNPHAQNEAEITDNIISHNTTAILNSVADFANVASGSFELYTKDSRGFETRETITAPIVNYVKLTCVLEVPAPTADGKTNITVKGNYFSGSFGATDNTLTIQFRMKVDSGEWTSWTNLDTPTVSSNKYTLTQQLQNLDYKAKYTFQARAVDKLTVKSSKEISVKTAPVFDWSADDFQFNVPVYTEDGFSLTGLAKALSNTYTLTATTTAGTNWRVDSFSAVLLGNVIRCQYDVARNPASGSGNISNELVMSVSIKHDGKIRVAYVCPFASGGTGGMATYAITDAARDDTYLTFNVNIAATGSAITDSTGAFMIPVSIDTTKY